MESWSIKELDDFIREQRGRQISPSVVGTDGLGRRDYRNPRWASCQDAIAEAQAELRKRCGCDHADWCFQGSVCQICAGNWA